MERRDMRVVKDRISLAELKALAEDMFGEMVKAVIDVATGDMVIGGELHSDEEALLLESGSRQEDLWGINLYPAIEGEDWIEFDSLINLRPSQGNRSRGVDDPATRERITRIVEEKVPR
jgi:hypothetical protein